MSKKTIIIVVSLFIALGTIGVFFFSKSPSSEQAMESAHDSDMTPVAHESMEQSHDSAMDSSQGYVPYSKEGFDTTKDKKRVLFFHAVWCPTCKVANEEFDSNSASIPNDIVLFKTDYDTENELKNKYHITYQHTFVLVAENGNELKKWNGGGLSELIQNTN